MKKRTSAVPYLLVCTLFCLATSPVVSQTTPQTQTTPPAQQAQAGTNDIGQVIFNMPKPDQRQQYIEGRKKHMAWHGSQNDKWTWHVFEVLNGEAGGGFIATSFDHSWADFDGREQFEAADQADAATNLAPYLTGAGGGPAFWRLRRDLARPSRPVPPPGGAPSPLSTVTHFFVIPGTAPDFEEAIKRINAGLDKVNYEGPQGYWYQLLNGGEGPHYVLVSPRKNFAEMGATPPMAMRQALQKAYGQQQGAALQQSIGKMCKSISTEMIRYRPDLSYTPGRK